jgi:hypothetical protein
MANISIEKIIPQDCPIGCANCTKCNFFGDVLNGSIVCYYEEIGEED